LAILTYQYSAQQRSPQCKFTSKVSSEFNFTNSRNWGKN